MTAQDDYQKLLAFSRETSTLGGIDQLLQWDQETYMPSDAAGARAEQCELMARMIHQRKTGKAFENHLSKLIDLESGKVRGKGLSLAQRACLREWREDFLRATKLPTRFVQESARLFSEAVEVWRSARATNSFGRFAPYLERIFETARKRADYLEWEHDPYDALVDEFEPGMTRRKVRTLFNSLKRELIPLRRELLSHPHPRRDFLHKSYSASKQMDFALELLEATGFTEERGNLSLTTHPFCSAPHPTDGRVTTRVDLKDPAMNFLASLHEGGHYLYEVNLPAEHFGSPHCEALSMAIHESQSRWWECFIGQTLPFWTDYFPKLKKLYPSQLKGVSLDTFYKGLNAILDTPIRVSSDEVSYPLHVILRFEIESELLDGSLKIRDLPDAWNARMEEYLDITPKNHSEGCLQDVHWSFGAVGYFPTYLLGNLYAGQLFETFQKSHTTWKKRVAKGEYAFVRDWLRDNIHQHGRVYPPTTLIQRVTGKSLSADPYLKHLRTKYRQIYR